MLDVSCTIKLMEGIALRKHSLHEKTTASVLLKPFISSNEWCHTTDALAHERNSIFKCKQHTCTLHDPWGTEKYDYTTKVHVPGHLWSVHAWVSMLFPAHLLPPYCGAGWEQVRNLVLWPDSHVTSQWDHAPQNDQWPST